MFTMSGEAIGIGVNVEGIFSYTPVIGYLTEALGSTEFTLIDIGCRGGIDAIWRSWGSRLRALALDPDFVEIDRLRRAETLPGVEYLAGLAALPADHSFALRRAGCSDRGRHPWSRLSVARSLEMVRRQGQGGPAPPVPGRLPLAPGEQAVEVVAANRQAEMQLSASPIIVPDLLRSRGITSVDFLKIDVDGKDFEILNSFNAALDGFGILGVGIEVTFPGAAGETDQSFHNVDRFMKARGFELCNLTTRRYSLSALPAPYVYDVPAQTIFGRPLLGDALYTRDLAAPEYEGVAAGLDPAKLLKLVCILAAFDLPDGGAEIILRFRDRVAGLVDVNHVLDLLAAQAQAPAEHPLTYREVVERFEGQDPMFFSAGAVPEDRQVRTLMLEMARLSEKVLATEAEIAAMKNSKFWRLRTGWFRVKRALGHGWRG